MVTALRQRRQVDLRYGAAEGGELDREGFLHHAFVVPVEEPVGDFSLDRLLRRAAEPVGGLARPAGFGCERREHRADRNFPLPADAAGQRDIVDQDVIVAGNPGSLEAEPVELEGRGEFFGFPARFGAVTLPAAAGEFDWLGREPLAVGVFENKPDFPRNTARVGVELDPVGEHLRLARFGALVLDAAGFGRIGEVEPELARVAVVARSVGSRSQHEIGAEPFTGRDSLPGPGAPGPDVRKILDDQPVGRAEAQQQAAAGGGAESVLHFFSTGSISAIHSAESGVA